MSPEVFKALAAVRLLALDCDGVLTGNELIYDKQGDDQHVFNARDGHGLMLLRRTQVDVVLITGRCSASARRRAEELKFKQIVERAVHKGSALKQFCSEQGYDPREVCYVGDDVNDLGAVKLAGVGVAVADAHPVLRAAADWVLETPGGKGAVREVCEGLLKAKGLWDEIIAHFASDVAPPFLAGPPKGG